MKPIKQLQKALDEESYEWLLAAHPLITDLIERAVQAGHSPEEIRRVVYRHTLRQEITQRCLAVARHLAGE